MCCELPLVALVSLARHRSREHCNLPATLGRFLFGCWQITAPYTPFNSYVHALHFDIVVFIGRHAARVPRDMYSKSTDGTCVYYASFKCLQYSIESHSPCRIVLNPSESLISTNFDILGLKHFIVYVHCAGIWLSAYTDNVQVNPRVAQARTPILRTTSFRCRAAFSFPGISHQSWNFNWTVNHSPGMK